jgi:hypothetical protein
MDLIKKNQFLNCDTNAMYSLKTFGFKEYWWFLPFFS